MVPQDAARGKVRGPLHRPVCPDLPRRPVRAGEALRRTEKTRRGGRGRGIDPTSDSNCRSTVLKPAAPTRTQTPPPPILGMLPDRHVPQVMDPVVREVPSEG